MFDFDFVCPGLISLQKQKQNYLKKRPTISFS